MTFTSAGDAADAIDNMDGNELHGRVLRVNLARPQKTPLVGMGNRASMFTILSVTLVCMLIGRFSFQYGKVKTGYDNMLNLLLRVEVCCFSSKIQRCWANHVD